jgi:hypothetical protein
MIHPYATEAYARSLGHWGEAVPVPEWGCHVILRGVHEGADGEQGGSDASGTYPVAVIAADADLPGGLERLRRLGLVSITLVLDDFHRPPLSEIKKHFSVVNPFKTHYIHRNALPFEYGKHHRYEVSRALKAVTVGQLELGNHVSEWLELYTNLTKRHGLAGIHDFPLSHYQALHQLSGTATIGAWLDGVLVSAHIWVSDGKYVHSHLAASSDDGYRAGAAYAVYDASIHHFAYTELLNLGGAAGASDDPHDGLARFKRGFSNEPASAYVCGAILDRARYDKLVRQSGVPSDTLFFPAYRARTV